MQEEFLQFKLQKVWVLVDLPKGKRAIGLKWVFRNKKDERRIVIRNKARLVAHGHTQEEGIDYDEVFASVARIEAIRLFLAYASFMGFMVYQMDVKSTFLYGTIKEEVYVCQPLGFEDPGYPDKVYKVVKALYGLHQAPRAWKFGFTDVKSASILIETEKPLLKDPDGEDVDVHIYSDYAGASLDRKSTTGGCQFLVNAARHFITAVSYELMLFGLLKVTAVNLMLLVKKVNDDVQLRALIDGKKVVVSEAIIRRYLHLDDADRVGCLPNAEIFKELTRMGYEKSPPNLTFYKAFFSAQWKFLIHTLIYMVRNVDSLSKFLMYPRFLQVVMDHQVDDMTTHNTRYTFPSLRQKVFANMRRVGKVFSGVETPLFDSTLVQPQSQAEEDVEMPIAPTPPSTTNQPITPHDSPPQDQPTTPHKSSMPLLTTLMETCATLSQKVAELEKDKHTQALEILQLKKRVKKLEKKKKSKSSGRMHPNKGKIAAIDADAGITLVDVETDKEVVAMDAETHGMLNQEDVSVVEPTVFDDEDVIMTIDQTLIKLKAGKAKLLDEHIS
uniref:Copia protein n=1 Tax=Tanacetum cinerariifolium TaxID=118510 RepID=A0A6L2JY98_TANCI|nr:copia protein [Tanacetum cinerariifolium]